MKKPPDRSKQAVDDAIFDNTSIVNLADSQKDKVSQDDPPQARLKKPLDKPVQYTLVEEASVPISSQVDSEHGELLELEQGEDQQ